MNVSHKKRIVKQCLAKVPTVDLLARVIWVHLLQLSYLASFGRSKVVVNRIIFECFKGKSINDSPLAIYKKLAETEGNYEFVWVVQDEGKILPVEISEDNRTSVVVYGSKEYYEAYASSGYWITNCRIPFRVVKKSSQTYVQCWHGTPLKKMAHDITVGNNVNTSLAGLKFAYRLEASKFDFFISPSEYASKCFCSSFNMRWEKILESGYPRNDDLIKFKNDIDFRNKVKKDLGINTDYAVVLYAPTWRDNQFSKESDSHVLDNPMDNIQFTSGFSNTIFLYRGHYFAKPETEMDNFIDVSNFDNLNALLLITDILVTDYSSLFFDFMNLGRKIVFYMPDLEEYIGITRGLYLNPETDLPGPVVKNLDQLYSELRNEIFDKEKFLKINSKYNPYEDGESALRVIRSIGLGRSRDQSSKLLK